MFDSFTKATNLITTLKSEIDVAYEIPDSTYMKWISALEQLLYGEIIHEQHKAIILDPEPEIIDLNSVYTYTEADKIRFEDICAV